MTNPNLVTAFQALIGDANVLVSEQDKAPFLTEWRDKFRGATPMVLRPGSTSEVAHCITLAAQHDLKVVPQGGNTGLVGGQIPNPDGSEIVLSLSRLTKIRDIDPEGYTMTVDAGVTLQAIHDAAEKHGCLFPLTLASQGSCQIGGNIATNAGGTAVVSYGNTRDQVLGLEVVLANGEVWNGLRTLRKDNTGYDLKQIFIGSEGTLGIITGASLKLQPAPASIEVALVALESPAKALSLFSLAKSHAGSMLTGFELMPQSGMQFVCDHMEQSRFPFEQQHPWYVLIEISAGTKDIDIASLTETIFTEAFEADMLRDGLLAQSKAQAADFWRLRHGLSEAQKFEGGSIKHDVSVPVAKVPEFLEEALEAVLKAVPGCRPVPFGHMGDGNIHFNITQPKGADKAEYLAKWDDVNRVVHGIVASYNGSISAEHGIGILKRDLLAEVKSTVEMNMMRSIKAALDPKTMFSPGRIL
ncbi:FAD-binding oxidoreductase [Pseudovibrio sp. Tun.PSC04-5.I4]|uniref:FAD-binding oxidoreductase n=1 Tax=Pseudovibrio sp. Tun.PSC04-5.I4 TaxID=1798213 RepID=UPI00088D7916|nr:FAD-binding oxidoreductase [Pseudovibrio sp. Tun.PSC04-5.I4]SDQ81834.1 FAD/FMN-containing dehydrogenase [Pseudovibrio sp. Tun.PSC04-5.I4]